ncbi:MAG: T9SS type A sorting domain-containing protein, partial [Bacteroidia bacterium]
DIDENGEPSLYLVQLKSDKVSIKQGLEPIKLITERKNPKWFTLGVRTSIAPNPTVQNIITFPNPAQNKLFISHANTHGAKYQVYNSMGKLVLKGALNTQNTIDLSTLRPGAFFLKLSSSQNIYTSTFIKE